MKRLFDCMIFAILMPVFGNTYQDNVEQEDFNIAGAPPYVEIMQGGAGQLSLLDSLFNCFMASRRMSFESMKYNEENHRDYVVKYEYRTLSTIYGPMKDTIKTIINRNNQVIEKTEANQRTEYRYDSYGNLSTIIDPLGQVTCNEYDEDGNLVQIIYPDGSKENFEYDGTGRKTAFIDRMGRTTYYGYSIHNLLNKIIYPDSSIELMNYDAKGRLISRTNENGMTISYQYNASGKRVKEIDAEGNISQFLYNSNGRLAQIVDHLKRRTNYSYDNKGRIIVTVFPDSTKEEKEYDAYGRLIRYRNRAGSTWEHQYDSDGTKRNVLMPGVSSNTEYLDEKGNVVVKMNEDSVIVQLFFRDFAGRVLEEIWSDEKKKSFKYDGLGRLIEIVDLGGQVTKYQYNSRNQITEIMYNDGTTQSFTYSYAGEKLSEKDQTGITEYYYDERGRLIERLDFDGRKVCWLYDDSGNNTGIVCGEDTVLYSYDALNRLDCVKHSEDCIAQYEYDAVNRITKIILSNGASTSIRYDSGDRVTEQKTANNTGEHLIRTLCQYDSTGKLIQMQNQAGDSIHFCYDFAGRISDEYRYNYAGQETNIKYTYTSTGKWETVRQDTLLNYFRYNENDWLTNVVTYSIHRSQYDLSDLKKLTEWDSIQVSYDDVGNVTQLKSCTSVRNFTYDGRYRLTEIEIISDEGNCTIQYQYDADDRVILKKTDDETVRYILDQADKAFPLLAEIHSKSGKILHYINGRLPIMQIDHSENFFLFDGFSTLSKIINKNQKAQSEYSYNSFGIPVEISGPGTTNLYFHGKCYDLETGYFIENGNFYDPQLDLILNHTQTKPE